jgi:outer membrane immunogenic protein
MNRYTEARREPVAQAFGLQNWTAELEYLNMGSRRFQLRNVLAGTLQRDRRPGRYQLHAHILRAGINYKFGGPVVAKY